MFNVDVTSQYTSDDYETPRVTPHKEKDTHISLACAGTHDIPVINGSSGNHNQNNSGQVFNSEVSLPISKANRSHEHGTTGFPRIKKQRSQLDTLPIGRASRSHEHDTFEVPRIKKQISQLDMEHMRCRNLEKVSHQGSRGDFKDTASETTPTKHKVVEIMYDDYNCDRIPRPSLIGRTALIPMEPEHKVKEKMELLNEWIIIAKNYSWLHNASAKLFQGLNYSLIIPIISVSTLGGALNLTQFTCTNTYIGYILGFLSLGSAALSTVHNTLKFGERSELHKATADEFDKLTREISVETLLSDTEAKTYANLAEFIKDCNDRFNRLVEKSPSIPEKVMNKFEKIKQNQQPTTTKYSYSHVRNGTGVSPNITTSPTGGDRGSGGKWLFDFHTSRHPVSGETTDEILCKLQAIERKKKIPCL